MWVACAVAFGLVVQAASGTGVAAQEVPAIEGSGEGSGEGAMAPITSLPPSRSVAIPSPAPGRAWTQVTRDQITLRLPRSTPEALRYEAGVFVQQTSQAQASPFIRGRTGQHVLLSFDGIRMNNSLFRQGPNQYLFTVDIRTIEAIDVIRGSSSVRFGADAIAGAIDAQPVEPTLDPAQRRATAHGALFFDYGSASQERGGRAQLDVQLGPHLALFGGFGGRRVGLLESAGPVRSPTTNELPEVPRFAPDGRTQLGTGFDELAGDLRIVADAGPAGRWTAAYYDYRQFDAPRTDQCPPAFAPFDECLTFDEQFRSLGYLRWTGEGTRIGDVRVTVHGQRQHERRSAERPSSSTINGGRDDVTTAGAEVEGKIRRDARGGADHIDVAWGIETVVDWVDSAAWLTFDDLTPPVTRTRSRGQYLAGSTYAQAGAWTEATWSILDRWALRGGGRLTHVRARAPGDTESDSVAIRSEWTTPVAGVGLSWEAVPWLTLTTSLDQGFRAPNLDDLTSRQRTGPGFQLENDALAPERSWTFEGGARVRHRWLSMDVWAYRMVIRNAIARASLTADACPAGTAACNGAWSILRLENVDGAAVIRGLEGSLTVHLPHQFELRNTLAWARGDEPVPRGEGRQPVSRIPPLNGTHSVVWSHALGLRASVGVLWAGLQDRLAIQDVADERIPRGGTPGYAVVHASVHYELSPYVGVSVVGENLADRPWRAHGSSINGAGRSVLLRLQAGW
jgi:iron complex outermembrane receptor protein/hemoglobin/transferrin/lactoferrin receptor protein